MSIAESLRERQKAYLNCQTPIVFSVRFACHPCTYLRRFQTMRISINMFGKAKLGEGRSHRLLQPRQRRSCACVCMCLRGREHTRLCCVCACVRASV